MDEICPIDVHPIPAQLPSRMSNQSCNKQGLNLTGRVARIIAEGLTEGQRAVLRAVSMNKVLNEWSTDLAVLKNYGLIKVEHSGERFELTLTEGGKAVAKAAFR